jgi:hypothetical protein
LVVSIYSTAQVRDVRSNIEKDKSKSEKSSFSSYRSEFSSSSYSPPELGDGLAEFLVGSLFYYTVYGIYRGLEYGQSIMQYRRDEHPETFSLEGELMAGFDFPNNVELFSSSARGNWGIFASDLSLRYVNDVTGELHALDWQVLKLRFPLKNIKFEYGLGFSHVFSPSKTYFDRSTGFDWCLFDRKATIRGQYRWSQKTSLDSRYRQEWRLNACYEMAQTGRLRFAPTVEFVYQNYFGTTQFHFLQLGLRLQLF